MPQPMALPQISAPSPVSVMNNAVTQAQGMNATGLPGSAVTPGAGGQGGLMGTLSNTFMNEGGGFNMENIGSFAETLGSLGTLWSGIQSNRIARDSLNMQKSAYKENLANQKQSYNTSVADRATARGAQYGDSGYAADYTKENSI